MTGGLAGATVGVVLSAAALLAFGGSSEARRRLRRSTHEPQPVSRTGRAGSARDGEGTSGAAGLNDTAMLLELIGAMLDAGSGLGRALQLVTGLASQELRVPLGPVVSALALGADWEGAWRSSGIRSRPGAGSEGRASLRCPHRGSRPRPFCTPMRPRIRRERFRTAEKEAAALGVKLVVPLGLCSLPAFVCLGILPVLLAMVPA